MQIRLDSRVTRALVALSGLSCSVVSGWKAIAFAGIESPIPAMVLEASLALLQASMSFWFLVAGSRRSLTTFVIVFGILAGWDLLVMQPIRYLYDYAGITAFLISLGVLIVTRDPESASRLGAARVLAWIFGVATAITVSCAALFSYFTQDEVYRASDSSGSVDAVLVETNAGAMTSFGYRVILTRSGWHWRMGTEVASLYGAVRSKQAYGANLVWRAPGELSVQYLDAEDVKLLLPTLEVAGEVVATSLDSGINDGTAPPGGLFYNLEGRPYDK
jgi:hypothetical protein